MISYYEAVFINFLYVAHTDIITAEI